MLPSHSISLFFRTSDRRASTEQQSSPSRRCSPPLPFHSPARNATAAINTPGYKPSHLSSAACKRSGIARPDHCPTSPSAHPDLPAHVQIFCCPDRPPPHSCLVRLPHSLQMATHHHPVSAPESMPLDHSPSRTSSSL